MGKCVHLYHRFTRISKKEQRRRLGLSLVWLRECGKSRVVASTTTFPTYNIKSRLRAASTSFWNTASEFAAAVPGIYMCVHCVQTEAFRKQEEVSLENVITVTFAIIRNKASIVKQSK